jgi:hypothetical protein
VCLTHHPHFSPTLSICPSRAIRKAAPILLNYNYTTGHPDEDRITAQLMNQMYRLFLNFLRDICSALITLLILFSHQIGE